MPELPEVETITNDLRALVIGRIIESVRVLDSRAVRYPAENEFELQVRSQRIVDITRRAKYILVRLSSGRFLVIQLRLTGQLLLVERSEPIGKSVRLIFDFGDGKQLRLADSSRFAQVHLLDENELHRLLPLDELGLEAISTALTLDRFREMLAGKHREIKPLLLDQRFISGIGNIYVDEALFAARIHPKRLSNSLTTEEVNRLYSAIRRILGEAISRRGTTIRSYRDVLGRKGHYQECLRVVRRTGEPCEGCSGTVEQSRVGGRETFFCPSCQQLSPTDPEA